MLAQRFLIRVATDRMAAFVSIKAGTKEDPTPELRAALAKAGVVWGLDEELLARLGERSLDPSFEQAETQVASGLAPLPGQPGYVELAFETGLAPGILSSDGHMDFFDRGLLKTVVAGQVVATIHPPDAGRVGVGVDGQGVPTREGVRVTLKWGPGVAVDVEGIVRARHNGVVLHKPGESLDVVECHEHRGAVDLHTGHLNMQGSLTVKGDVERLLQVCATGDLEVLGSVSGGSLCAGGSVRVSGNVHGGDGARIVADHDVTLKSCEAAEVLAGGVLRVQEAVNSSLSGLQVLVGRLRGGVAIAERSLIVKEAGTRSGLVTRVQAGELVELPDVEEVQRAVLMQKLRRMAERGGVREVSGSRGAVRSKGGKLGRVDAAYSAEQLQDLVARARRRGELERVAVIELGLAQPGVELRIGSACLVLEQGARDLRYALDAETGQLVAQRSLG